MEACSRMVKENVHEETVVSYAICPVLTITRGYEDIIVETEMTNTKLCKNKKDLYICTYI